MSSLTRRTQILLDEERHQRLSTEARDRGASVAELIREAIDQAFPSTSADRQKAAERFLELARDRPLSVPDFDQVRAEILSMSDRPISEER